VEEIRARSDRKKRRRLITKTNEERNKRLEKMRKNLKWKHSSRDREETNARSNQCKFYSF
jgi:uncharacterized protein YwgA